VRATTAAARSVWRTTVIVAIFMGVVTAIRRLVGSILVTVTYPAANDNGLYAASWSRMVLGGEHG
jgi:hypothetical protein